MQPFRDGMSELKLKLELGLELWLELELGLKLGLGHPRRWKIAV